MDSLMEFIQTHFYQWMFDGVMALLILILFTLFFRLTVKPLERFLQGHKVDEYLVKIVTHSLYKTVVVIMAVITALAQLGVNVIAAMTGFGIVGIAISFAAKDTLGNIIAGLMILWDKPFGVGDWVEVEGQFGRIQAITLRTTRIHTRNNFHVVIPNQNVINSTVINHHCDRPVRKTTYFPLPYDCDLVKAQEVLLEAVQGMDCVLETPAPGTGVSDVKDGLVEVAVLHWVENAERGIGQSGAVREVGIQALREAGFAAPLPIRLAREPHSAPS